VREDIIAAGISPDDLKGVKIISLSSHSDATTALASIVIAVPTVFERTGLLSTTSGGSSASSKRYRRRRASKPKSRC
jgi:hypothetical protein